MGRLLKLHARADARTTPVVRQAQKHAAYLGPHIVVPAGDADGTVGNTDVSRRGCAPEV